MKYRIGFLCLLALAVVAASGGLAIQSSASSVPATPSIHMAAFGPLGANPATAARRFECYIGHQHESPYMQMVRSTHAKSLILLYEIAAAAADAHWAYSDADINDPIGYYWIKANHPEWLLKDLSGKVIRFDSYSYLVAMDPGNPDYQKTWAQKAIQRLHAIRADGIMIDCANTFHNWSFKADPQKYPDAQSYAQAMDSFMCYVTQQIKAAGFLVLANGSGEPWNTGMWSSWIEMLDGRVSENNAYPNEALWTSMLESYEQYPDKTYVHLLPSTIKTNANLARFMLASFLLWQGPHSYLGLWYCDDATLPYDLLMDLRLGDPTGQCEQVTDMTYHRTYQYGDVFVNASASLSTAIQVTVAGKDTSGKSVAVGTRVLGPRQWLIVIRSG